MKTQNDVLQNNVNKLQSVVDTMKVEGPITDNHLLLEEIKWNTYFYKKYKHQTNLMGVIIGICILLNLFHNAIPKQYFIAGAGFILSVAFMYVLYVLWDLNMRDSLNFDEYSFYNYKGGYPKSNHPNNIETDASNCALNKIVDYYA